ncbi:MAG: radical SAM protein [Candidatus Omnitrophica bacterium]|nr:radical SAM protein [Candidatus Omnitrophota bacterium]
MSVLPKALFLNRIIRSNFGRPSFPYKLTFAVTYRCNLRCKTCLIWSKEPKQELSLDEISEFFKRSNGFSWVDLTGGEIFLREDLPEIIDIILSNCRSLCILHFPTNGQLTEKALMAAEKIRNDSRAAPVVTVSIDGPEGIHNRIRGSENAWKKAVDTFIELKKSGLRHVYIGYTISEFNIGKIDETFLEIKNLYPLLNYNDIHANLFHTSQHYLNNSSIDAPKNDLVLEEYGYLQKKRRNKKLKYILEKRYFAMAPRYLATKKMPVKCQALGSSFFLDPYGDIYPCSIFDRKISNIRDIGYDLKKIWNNGEKLADTRNDILNKNCDGCWTPCEAYPSLLGSL